MCSALAAAAPRQRSASAQGTAYATALLGRTMIFAGAIAATRATRAIGPTFSTPAPPTAPTLRASAQVFCRGTNAPCTACANAPMQGMQERVPLQRLHWLRCGVVATPEPTTLCIQVARAAAAPATAATIAQGAPVSTVPLAARAMASASTAHVRARRATTAGTVSSAARATFGSLGKRARATAYVVPRAALGARLTSASVTSASGARAARSMPMAHSDARGAAPATVIACITAARATAAFRGETARSCSDTAARRT